MTREGDRRGELDQALASGQTELALSAIRRAVALSREVGHLPGEAEALALTGDLEEEAGQHARARRSWRLAAGIFGDLNDPRAGDLLARAG